VFPIDEREALDIDTWPTLDVIERFLVARRTGEERVWKYIDGRTIRPFMNLLKSCFSRERKNHWTPDCFRRPLLT